jgi:hypothetical protein
LGLVPGFFAIGPVLMRETETPRRGISVRRS